MTPDQARRLEGLLAQPDIKQLFAALDGAGAELRIVGGAVRNALIGLPPGDIDCATTSLPAETIRRASLAGLRTVPTGIDHGTVTVIVAGTPFEVTTLREDVETDGRHAIVRFGHDFRHDAERRDFTINAMSLDAHGYLHDYTDGLKDLAERRVRFIGEPDRRIREDYLRILRFFRFHAEYGDGAPDRAALDAALRHRHGLDGLSRERVRQELAKLLMAPRAVAVVADLAAAGLLDRLLSGIGEVGRLSRLAATLPEAGWSERLAVLAVRTSDDVERLRARLRLSNEETASLAAYARALVELKSTPVPIDRRLARAGAYRLALRPLMLAAIATQGEARPAWTPDGRAALAALDEGREHIPTTPFSGDMLKSAGVPQGPRIGAIIRRAEALWLAEDFPADEEACARILNQALNEA